MILNPRNSVAFTGHRSYRDEARALLPSVLESLYVRGYRNFLSGMAIGFDLAAAEAVVALRRAHSDVRLIAVVPFRNQSARFPADQRLLYERLLSEVDGVEILSETYHRGCYARRNDFLVDHARVIVAWYDGTTGSGTHYTVERARARNRVIFDLRRPVPHLSEACAELF